MYLRQIIIQDKPEIKSIYFDAIKSIDEKIYSKEQKFAWSCQAWENPEFDKAIINGKGWVAEEGSNLKGFAIRYPSNKLSLLYCRSNSKKKGIGSLLLKRIEEDAKIENISCLKTEASLISYKLLLKNEWIIVRKEKVIIKNSIFNRYKMMKILS